MAELAAAAALTLLINFILSILVSRAVRVIASQSPMDPAFVVQSKAQLR
jgi:hypothetical protein